jgi:hypothetical protein
LQALKTWIFFVLNHESKWTIRINLNIACFDWMQGENKMESFQGVGRKVDMWPPHFVLWREIWHVTIHNFVYVTRYLFEQNKVDVMEVKNIRKNEVVKWCRHHLGCCSTLRRELCIHIWGTNALLGKVNDNERPQEKMVPQRHVMLVHDLKDFKANQEVFSSLHWGSSSFLFYNYNIYF